MLACDAADLDAGNISNVNTPGCHVADLGNPQIVETVLRLSPLPRVNDGLIKGLLAYSRGISEADKTWLAEIDPRSLAPRGAAHLALRRGNADCGGAIEQGDLLSGSGPHLAPGTLLEEAALRRETVITALMEDFEKFEMLSSQYLRRFGDSVYAPEFTGRFAVAVATDDTRQMTQSCRGRCARSTRTTAALDLAVRLRMPPQVDGPLAGPPEVTAEQGKQVEFGLTDQVLEQARTVTGSADKLLDGELR
jgi:hypothetical protein